MEIMERRYEENDSRKEKENGITNHRRLGNQTPITAMAGREIKVVGSE